MCLNVAGLAAEVEVIGPAVAAAAISLAAEVEVIGPAAAAISPAAEAAVNPVVAVEVASRSPAVVGEKTDRRFSQS